MTVLAGLLLAPLIAVQGVKAQPSVPDPAQLTTEVKAAYLYKFGNYVEWPALSFETAETPIRIGVAEEGRLADTLTRIVTGRTVNGRQMQVRALQPGDPVDGLHILFIGDQNPVRRAEILAATEGRPILTVTDSEQAFAMGSMINFVLVDGKLRFDIAPRAREPDGLRISARLLATARKVLSYPS